MMSTTRRSDGVTTTTITFYHVATLFLSLMLSSRESGTSWYESKPTASIVRGGVQAFTVTRTTTSINARTAWEGAELRQSTRLSPLRGLEDHIAHTHQHQKRQRQRPCKLLVHDRLESLTVTSPSKVISATTLSAAPTSYTDVALHDNYGETSRAYRRTVYTFDDWKRHRDPDRFFKRAKTVFRSGIYRNIRSPVKFVTAVSLAVVVWNTVVSTATTTSPLSSLPPLTLPLQPFNLSSASLGLLLTFRSNTAYGRWDEARKSWGMNINRTRDLLRMAVSWYDETYSDDRRESSSSSSSATAAAARTTTKRQEDLTSLALATWAFVRCMKRHLSPDDDEIAFQQELHTRLPKEQAEAILKADHRPNRALFDLSVAIENLPMHFLRKNQMHLALTKFEDNLGSSERLLSSPVPLFYSRHLQRFLLCWLAGLPLAMSDVFSGPFNRFMLVPTTALISTFMFGIDELANQMEEPFTILPQQQFCDRIYKWCMEMIAWKPGDNGTRLNCY